jgi:hypothetical protein
MVRVPFLLEKLIMFLKKLAKIIADTLTYLPYSAKISLVVDRLIIYSEKVDK